MNTRSALNAYRQVSVQGEVQEADPHRLIQMLFDGALERIATARICMQQGATADKGERISRAIEIIEGLRATLDRERGGPIADNLDGLYSYMTRRLLEANLHNDVERLDEVSGLLKEIKSGWDAVRPAG
ncbi:MAG: flagellar export chaperone FliS [Chromatiales bacterium]|nr:flagellar export chaperone FliS [Chromatiales bacterium]